MAHRLSIRILEQSNDGRRAFSSSLTEGFYRAPMHLQEPLNQDQADSIPFRPLRRYHSNERYLLDESMEQILHHAPAGKMQAFEAYLAHVHALRERIVSLPKEGGAYGLIHGGLHGRNRHYDAATRFTLFNFDHGGYGCRAYDPIETAWKD